MTEVKLPARRFPGAIQIERLEPGAPRRESRLPIELALRLCVRRAALFHSYSKPACSPSFCRRGLVHPAGRGCIEKLAANGSHSRIERASHRRCCRFPFGLVRQNPDRRRGSVTQIDERISPGTGAPIGIVPLRMASEWSLPGRSWFQGRRTIRTAGRYRTFRMRPVSDARAMRRLPPGVEPGGSIEMKRSFPRRSVRYRTAST